MPIVFVHGVANRDDADFRSKARARDAFLKRVVAPVVNIDPAQEIIAPYWGGNGVAFWNNLSVVPSGSEVEAFGPSIDFTPSLAAALGTEMTKAVGGLDAILRAFPEVAIDLVFDQIVAEALPCDDPIAIAEAYGRLLDKFTTDGPGWLEGVTSADLTGKIVDVISPVAEPNGVQAFGIQGLVSEVWEAVERTKNLLADLLSHAVVRAARGPVTRSLATFVGDAFVYLSERGNGVKPGKIAGEVMDSIARASAIAKEKDEPLVIISHSFGGEIVYDVLTHYFSDQDLVVDAWVTVGSQVGLFEEMSLLWKSPRRNNPHILPAGRIASPASVKRWINIVDTNDVLGFLVEPVFIAGAGGTVKDYIYDTGLSVNGAHSGYFKWPSFYRRLADRLR